MFIRVIHFAIVARQTRPLVDTLTPARRRHSESSIYIGRTLLGETADGLTSSSQPMYARTSLIVTSPTPTRYINNPIARIRWNIVTTLLLFSTTRVVECFWIKPRGTRSISCHALLSHIDGIRWPDTERRSFISSLIDPRRYDRRVFLFRPTLSPDR